MAKKASKKVAKKTAKKSPKKSPAKVAKKVAKKVVAKSSPAKTKVAKKPAPKKVAAKKPATKKPAPKKPAAKPAAKAPAAVASAVAQVGSAAPHFSLPASNGKTLSLADYAGKTLVLYFYPRADTPGCTVQACAFRDAIASYADVGADVLGISPDPIKDVTAFANKFNLSFPLLADADHKIAEAYGVWVEKSMYGKTYMGVARTTFIIRDGSISHVMEKVKPEGHDVEVLKILSA